MFCVFSQWPDSLRPLDNGCCSRGMMALDRITDTLVPEKQNKQTNLLLNGGFKPQLKVHCSFSCLSNKSASESVL